MLTRRVRALAAGTLCLAPDVKADGAADIVFSSSVGCHMRKFAVADARAPDTTIDKDTRLYGGKVKMTFR